jgi:hypothetical protein
VNGNATTGAPASNTVASSPLAVVVGQGSNSAAGGSLVDVNTPVDADGSTPSTSGTGLASSQLINLGQESASPLGGASGTGTLVNVNAPVSGSTNGATATPAGTSVPLINVG